MVTVVQSSRTQWIRVGVPMDILFVAVTPSSSGKSATNLFAYSNKFGLYNSTDVGRTWITVGRDLNSLAIQALTASGNCLFAATYFRGVQRSTDNGETWSSANKGLPSPASDYAGDVWLKTVAVNGPNLFVGGYRGVFRSTDKGETWNSVNAELKSIIPRPMTGDARPPAIMFLRASDGYLFAGAAVSGVYLSTNNGKNWTDLSEGLPGTPGWTHLAGLAVTGSDLYAAIAGSGVFRSPDDGRSWTAVNAGLPGADVRSLAASGGSVFAGSLDGGVFLSTNKGAKWCAVRTGLPGNRVLDLVASGDYLFAVAYPAGLYRRSISEMIAEASKVQ